MYKEYLIGGSQACGYNNEQNSQNNMLKDYFLAETKRPQHHFLIIHKEIWIFVSNPDIFKEKRNTVCVAIAGLDQGSSCLN